MREKLKAALLRHSPDMKDHIADRCVDRYQAAVMQEIAMQFALMTRADITAGEMNFRAEHVMYACGQVQSGGKQKPSSMSCLSTKLFIAPMPSNGIASFAKILQSCDLTRYRVVL